MKKKTQAVRAIGPYSAADRLAKLDGRTREAALSRATRAALVKHVGGEPSAAQSMLIDRCVQLTLRVSAMDRRFAESGAQTDHDARCYLAWSNTLTRALRELGMQAAPTPQPNGAALANYLRAKTEARPA